MRDMCPYVYNIWICIHNMNTKSNCLNMTFITVCVCPYSIYTVFLISSNGAPLAQRTSYFTLHSSLFGPDGAVNIDNLVYRTYLYMYIIYYNYTFCLIVTMKRCPYMTSSLVILKYEYITLITCQDDLL